MSSDKCPNWVAPLAMLTAAVAAFAYLPSFAVPFQFDDHNSSLLLNPAFKGGVHWGEIAWLPGRALTTLTFALNLAAHGPTPLGFHVVNFAIHLATVAVLFAVLRRLLGGGERACGVAVAVAALYALHPMQTQAVTYIVQRLASLATLFYATALLFYLRQIQRREAGERAWRDLLCAVGAAAAAVVSKEIGATVVAAFLLLELLYGGLTAQTIGKRRRELAAAAVLCAIVLGVAAKGAQVIREFSSDASVQHGPLYLTYLLTELKTLPLYWRLAFWPSGQRLLYDIPLADTLLDPEVLVALVLHATLLFCAWRARRRIPALSFGIAFFYLALLPESAGYPLPDLFFEHRFYLPGLGIAAAVAGVIDFGLQKRVGAGKALAALAVVVAVAAAIATYERNQVWLTNISLWRDVVEKAPDIPRGYANLAYAYLEREQPQEAVEVGEAALRRGRASTMLLFNLANAYGRLDRVGEALTQMRAAAARKDASPMIFESLGVTEILCGNRTQAAAAAAACGPAKCPRLAEALNAPPSPAPESCRRTLGPD